MGAAEFRIRAETVLGGWGWRVRLARGTGANYATVKRWASGITPVPKWMSGLLEALEQLRSLDRPLPDRFT